MKKQMSRNPKLKQFPHGLGCEKASVAISNGKFESHKKHKTSKTIKKLRVCGVVNIFRENFKNMKEQLKTMKAITKTFFDYSQKKWKF